MGSNVSSNLSDGNEDEDGEEARLADIPESCIALIMMHLTPCEIYELASLNKAFRSASTADFIWESKLPSNYQFIVDKVFDELSVAGLGKKDLFSRLCRPNLFDGGTKEVWLDKNSGQICLSISSKALRITGIDDRRYWSHIPTQESRFESVAYVQQVWWFEVGGEINFHFPPGTYSLFFRLHLGRSTKKRGRWICSSNHIHGWDIKPVQFRLTTSDGQHAVSQCYLDSPGNWINYHVGDFIVENSSPMIKVTFWMAQIDCTHTKGGLCVDAVFINPKGVET